MKINIFYFPPSSYFCVKFLKMKLQESNFGNLPDGREVKLFTLTNDHNLTVKITNYGGIITGIKMPDKNGNIDNIACGFEKLENYLSDEYLESYPYFGALIGRFGNRIAKGHLEVEGETYNLAVNNGPNHLHGGKIGFDRRLWNTKTFESPDKAGIELTYTSPDMEENYPGEVQVKCIYTLNNNNELEIEYFAETDKTTVINLTNHTYFNLSGGKENILQHELKLNADKQTEMVEQIPTGKIVSVIGTTHDFTEFKAFSKDIEKLPTGYDENFVLDNEQGNLKFAGSLRDKNTGRQVDVQTTQPGIQLYTGYWIPELEIDGEKKFGSYSGVALETQHYPDSVHHDNFPSTLLKPGEKYNEKTSYKFLIK